MYSLGIILFEIYQPFKTDMEKVIDIDRLKTTKKVSESMNLMWPKQV